MDEKEVKEEQIKVDESEEDADEELEDARDALIESVITARVDFWLEQHGPKLFALEYSKADVKERKRNLKLQPGYSPNAVPVVEREEGVSSFSTEPATKRRRHR